MKDRIENPEATGNYSNWTRPNFENERGEVERVIREFLQQDPNEEEIQHIIQILNQSPLVDLSDEEWEKLENTDSFENIRPGFIEDAKNIVEEYNLKLPPGHKRDAGAIIKAFSEGLPMEAPAILKNKNGALHLVSGNTRLMLARALNIRPKVIIGGP